jgi:DNA-binding transcriptional LysR family regulator
MELHALKVFLAVATEKSFSRAAERMSRTQPAISLAVQRLETELNEKLIDRSAKDLMLTDAGKIVLEYARRFENLEREMETSLSELRDNSAGRLTIGANESTSLYLMEHIQTYRHLYPRIRVEVRRCLSSRIPSLLVDGELELGVISFDPMDQRVDSTVIYTDHVAFVVSPEHALAGQTSVSITELGSETFIAHNVMSPYRDIVIHEFQKHRVPLNIQLEMPTVETIRRMVQRNEGVAFLPRMCVEREVAAGTLNEVRVPELEHVVRLVRLVHPAKRALSHAAGAFLELVRGETLNGKAKGASQSPPQ